MKYHNGVPNFKPDPILVSKTTNIITFQGYIGPFTWITSFACSLSSMPSQFDTGNQKTKYNYTVDAYVDGINANQATKFYFTVHTIMDDYALCNR